MCCMMKFWRGEQFAILEFKFSVANEHKFLYFSFQSLLTEPRISKYTEIILYDIQKE